MTVPKIRIKTEGFRAINKSDIIINGITVVAGENGCGKSTISKLLYYLYKTTSNYNELVAVDLSENLKNIYRFLDIMRHEIFPFIKDRNKREDLKKELIELRNNKELPINIQEDRWISTIQKTESVYINLISDDKENQRFKERISRLKYILKDILNEKKIELVENNNLPFEKIIEVVESLFKEAYGKMESRPSSLFNEALFDVFGEVELPKLFEVLEFDQHIVSNTKNYLSIPYTIQNSIYIDSPLMIGENFYNNEYWNDLNDLLIKKGKSNFSKLSQQINKDVINGDISVEDDPFSNSGFIFKRNDGAIFNLLDCATGVKSFAILQLLLNNGSLTDKTLLIIDEPESHLHPQWIIEYARLIVLLNKEIGVNFFIASHNPDMVSAIKYISEKEGTTDGLNFYLAEKEKNKLQYNYRHLRTEIDPIFGSFNIAIDRINMYGA